MVLTMPTSRIWGWISVGHTIFLLWSHPVKQTNRFCNKYLTLLGKSATHVIFFNIAWSLCFKFESTLNLMLREFWNILRNGHAISCINLKYLKNRLTSCPVIKILSFSYILDRRSPKNENGPIKLIFLP